MVNCTNMSQTDVDMEDTKSLVKDPRNHVQDSESKVRDLMAGSEGEFHGASAAIENVDKIENGRGDSNEPSIEDKDKIQVKNQVEKQINPESEAKEPIEASDHEKVDTKSNNEELIDMKSEVEEPTAARSALGNQTDAKNDVVGQEGVSNAEKSDNNFMEAMNDVAEGKTEEIVKEVSNFVEPIEEVETKLERTDCRTDSKVNRCLPAKLPTNESLRREVNAQQEIIQLKEEEMDKAGDKACEEARKGQDQAAISGFKTDGNAIKVETAANEMKVSSVADQREAFTPNSLATWSSAGSGDYIWMGESDDGTPEEQTAFLKEIETFYREKAMDFKQPKFYGQPLNCLKLWRAVIRLGGYDKVTGSKLWRQVGESFHPPKTCTTVSWTFRIFYEKSLLEYERHRIQRGELQLPLAAPLEASGVDAEGNGYQGSGPGRARRDAASRAMQGWHAQRLFANGEVDEPIMKDKSLNNVTKREKNVKFSGSIKQKRPHEVEQSNKAARVETSMQLETSVVDAGPPADWVKINVRQTPDCFEVYALVPGLLREEVRVQSDPAGRVVITGHPVEADNPWGITPFRKVVSLPERIDPLQTSAVVSMHGRLFVRVPFEQPTPRDLNCHHQSLCRVQNISEQE